MNEDFLDILREMTDAGVEFLVVGAHALAVHGCARATGDIDILVRPDPANAARVVAALLRFGAPLAAHGIAAADLAKEGTVYQLGLPPRRIDVLTRISGVPFDEAWQTRVFSEVGGLHVAFLGRDALARNKRAAGRPKDLSDLALLEEADGGPTPRETS